MTLWKTQKDSRIQDHEVWLRSAEMQGGREQRWKLIPKKAGEVGRSVRPRPWWPCTPC